MRRVARSARIVRAATVAAALAVGAALTGCTVAVEGTPQAAPQPVAGSTPQTATERPVAPGSPLPRGLGGEDLTPHAGVLQRWVADDWRPTPLLRQTDPATGVSAAMFGRARPERSGNGAPYFAASGAPAGIITTFGAAPSEPGHRVDVEEAARQIAAGHDGRLVSHERIVVDGMPAQDSVIDTREPSGTETRQLMRWIELPDHNILVQAIGNRSEAPKMEQVRDIITSTIRVP